MISNKMAMVSCIRIYVIGKRRLDAKEYTPAPLIMSIH